MTEEQPPRVFTASRWLLSGLVTTSLFFGAIGGLAVLFVGDTFFEKTPAPAITAVATSESVARVQQRIDQLEKKLESAAPVSDNAAVEAELAALREKIAEVQTAEAQANIGPVLLGLTQLGLALDHDLPLSDGIETLKSAVTQGDAQSLLAELSTLAQGGIPSYDELRRDLAALKPQTPQTPPAQDLSWAERGKALLGKFVRVRPTHQATQDSVFASLERSLQSRDLPIVRDTLVQFPSTPALQSLVQKIENRIRAEKLVRDLIVTVTKSLGASSQGSLY